MHYKLYISKWIPYPIREDIKEKRVKMAVDILNVLEKGETAWMDTITGDESWFFWAYEHDQQWLPEGSERPKIPKPNIGMKKKKTLFSIYFSLRGFILIEDLPQNQKFNLLYPDYSSWNIIILFEI